MINCGTSLLPLSFTLSGSHSVLLQDPDGAYSQLIRLQESGKKQEQKDLNHSDSARRSFSVEFAASPMISISEKSFDERIGSPASEKLQLPQAVPLSRLARLNSPEIPILLLGCISAVAHGVITPIFGTVFAAMIRIFYEPKEELTRDSKYWALVFVVLGVASFFTSPMSTYFFAVAGCKLIMRIRSMCFEKVLYMEIGWFDEAEHSSGAIGSRLSSDAASVRSLVGDTLSLIVQSTATAVAGLVIAFKASWRLSLLILAMFPLLGVSSYIQLRSVQVFGGKSKKRHEEASQVVSDAVSCIRTVASFSAEEKVIQVYNKKCEGPIKAATKQGLISGLGFGISFFCFFLLYAVCFYFGGYLLDHGKVFCALSMTAVGISQTSFLAPDVGKAKSSAASIFKLLDQISKIDSSDNSGKTLENVRGEVEFQHVSFKYPTRPDIEIFRDLCLTIHSGKVILNVNYSIN
ncbi:hypothetical protein Pint_24168 [Pistacia integerrima]|uniref:Uncharacterized protein n=1 Tax=Pistacia integerrima TaxID=434235 RepID=A0ACC0YC87_9ROSI|nr:hypothetical protein Pint_24168 [Pistacia integerrima]